MNIALVSTSNNALCDSTSNRSIDTPEFEFDLSFDWRPKNGGDALSCLNSYLGVNSPKASPKSETKTSVSKELKKPSAPSSPIRSIDDILASIGEANKENKLKQSKEQTKTPRRLVDYTKSRADIIQQQRNHTTRQDKSSFPLIIHAPEFITEGNNSLQDITFKLKKNTGNCRQRLEVAPKSPIPRKSPVKSPLARKPLVIEEVPLPPPPQVVKNDANNADDEDDSSCTSSSGESFFWELSDDEVETSLAKDALVGEKSLCVENLMHSGCCKAQQDADGSSSHCSETYIGSSTDSFLRKSSVFHITSSNHSAKPSLNRIRMDEMMIRSMFQSIRDLGDDASDVDSTCFFGEL